MSDPAVLEEKVLQFGTGILLRGLPDYFINKANSQGAFNGKIVVVKSTPGNVDDFAKFGPSFVTCIRGIDRGKPTTENVDNTAVSRVLNAQNQWNEVLDFSGSTSLQMIISNTTEVGIRFEPESIFTFPPASFPAKLTAVLYERFKRLGDQSDDIAIVPTELVPDNGKLLYEIVMRLVTHNKLEVEFERWLSGHALFCNSLVDRIVTRPSPQIDHDLKENPLTIQAEPYRLWAIQGNDRVRKILSFSAADEGVIIADNIEYFRERKLRLLNGAHSISVCLGFLSGFNTVYECMQDNGLRDFVENVMHDEIEPSLTLGSEYENRAFAREVLDRFANPFTAHRLLSITMQATAKMKMRNVATFFRYSVKFGRAPELMTRGFASYLLFMRSQRIEKGNYIGLRKGEPYLIIDDKASYFFESWARVDATNDDSLKNFVIETCQNKELWDKDLTQIPMFVDWVSAHLSEVIQHTTR